MRKMRNINMEEAKRLYYDQQLSADAVAERLNVAPTTLKEHFKRAGLPTRGHREAGKLAAKQGKLSTCWKGGRIINSCGYVMVIDRNGVNKKTKYVLEHVLVWEKVHNRPLPKGWVIHHLNGIKIDNRPSNLVAMLRARHTRFERAEPYKKRIRELEAEVNILRRALEDSQAIFYVGGN